MVLLRARHSADRGTRRGPTGISTTGRSVALECLALCPGWRPPRVADSLRCGTVRRSAAILGPGEAGHSGWADGLPEAGWAGGGPTTESVRAAMPWAKGSTPH